MSRSPTTTTVRDLLIGEYDCLWVWMPQRGIWEFVWIDKETDGQERFFCRAGFFEMGEAFKNLVAIPITKPEPIHDRV